MRRAKMGVCPLCGGDIYTDQPTAWRTVDGSPARVHGTCLAPPVTRRKVALPLPTGYAGSAATRAVQGGHTDA